MCAYTYSVLWVREGLARERNELRTNRIRAEGIVKRYADLSIGLHRKIHEKPVYIVPLVPRSVCGQEHHVLGQFLLQIPTVSSSPPPSTFVWNSSCTALPTARRRASTSGHDCQTW